MNELQNFTNGIFNLDVKVDGENILFSAEQVAKTLGITQMKNGKEYVKWERVNSYLPNSPEVGKGSFISEPMVYKLAFKANIDDLRVINKQVLFNLADLLGMSDLYCKS